MLRKIGIGFIGILGIVSLIEGIFLKTLENKNSAMSIGVIGAADGPTSIFLAGKLSPANSIGNILLVVGAGILIILGILFFIKKYNKR